MENSRCKFDYYNSWELLFKCLISVLFYYEGWMNDKYLCIFCIICGSKDEKDNFWRKCIFMCSACKDIIFGQEICFKLFFVNFITKLFSHVEIIQNHVLCHTNWIIVEMDSRTMEVFFDIFLNALWPLSVYIFCRLNLVVNPVSIFQSVVF